MDPIYYIDRQTKQKCIEKVYGEKAIKLLYGDDLISKVFGTPLLHLSARIPFCSALYGQWQRLSSSRKKILPFIKNFDVNPKEFVKSIDQFDSFNDFFIRKLKPECRPIFPGDKVAIIPADGRYYFYQDLSVALNFCIKQEKLSLNALLEDDSLSRRYSQGTMIIARLCPADYHRFHFPIACLAGKTRLINGWLYSVNPAALKRDVQIFTKNKRTLCELRSEHFGKVLFMEIGATNVGSIQQTYTPNQLQAKGEEKGFFSFGSSSLILIFEKNRLTLDSELIEASQQNIEMRCLIGQRMGVAN